MSEELKQILIEIVDEIDSLATRLDRADDSSGTMVGWNPSLIRLREKIDELK